MEDGGGGVGNGGAMRGRISGAEWIDRVSERIENPASNRLTTAGAVWGVVKAVVGHCAGTC